MKPTQAQPTSCTALASSSPIEATAVSSTPPRQSAPTTFVQKLNWFGGKLLDIAESIGEGVVSILGLDDSHFQDILDNMTEEEMAAAVEVNERRTEEYKQAGMLPETILPNDLTVDDIGVDLYSTVDGTQRYQVLDSDHADNDIENPCSQYAQGGNNSSGRDYKQVEMKPTVSVSRPAEEVRLAQNDAAVADAASSTV